MKTRRFILLLTCLGLILTSHAQQRCVQNQLQILRRRARRTETHESRALRLTPSLYFGSKHIELRELGSGETKSVDLKSCYLAVPTHFKIAAPRFNNYRPYVVAGVSPMYDLTTGKRTLIKTRPLTLMLEAGLGCDIYLPFFKFIPELKFSFGLNNVLQKTRNDLTDPTQKIYTQSIDKATLGMVTLNFYFE